MRRPAHPAATWTIARCGPGARGRGSWPGVLDTKPRGDDRRPRCSRNSASAAPPPLLKLTRKVGSPRCVTSALCLVLRPCWCGNRRSAWPRRPRAGVGESCIDVTESHRQRRGLRGADRLWAIEKVGSHGPWRTRDSVSLPAERAPTLVAQHAFVVDVRIVRASDAARVELRPFRSLRCSDPHASCTLLVVDAAGNL